MSATIDPTIFQEQFMELQKDIPVNDIPGRTFPITEYYNDGSNYIWTTLSYLKKWKNILLFSKWKKEIQEIVEKLKQNISSFELDWERFQVEVMPLHSELPIEYQTSLLQNPPNWVKRIIVSTNVAEESITIPYINTVVDLWKWKISICNEFWVPTLVTHNISKANSKQRKWRWWRVMEWDYIRENSTPYDKLDEYPQAPIEREMIDREVLACLKIWIDIMSEIKNLKKEWKKLFFHDVPLDLLKLSYINLRRIWAISSKNQLTKLWNEILKYPLSVYNSRILIESIERWCSYDIILMVCIIEKNWFVNDWDWSKIKLKNKAEWDLFAFSELFNFITSKYSDFENWEYNIWKLEQLIWMWISWKEIEKFITEKSDLPLFQVVDLEKLWIKTKKVEQIYTLLTNLKSRLENWWVNLQQTDDIEQIKFSLASWNLQNVFISEKSNGSKYQILRNNRYKKYEFILWKSSLLKLEVWKLYIWSPFIVWWEDWKNDINLLTNVTPIDHYHLEEFPDYENDELFELFWEKIWNEKKILLKNSLKFYHEKLDDFSYKLNKSSFSSTKEAKIFYWKNVLPELMLSNNKYVINFVRSKWQKFDLFAFKEILKRFIVSTNLDRINPDNTFKTDKSFIDDTSILDDILSSNDQFVVKILKLEKINLSELKKPEEKDEPFVLQENTEIDNNIIFALHRKYSSLKSTKLKNVNLDDLLKKCFSKLSKEIFVSQEFLDLQNYLNKLESIEDSEISELLKLLKNINKYKLLLSRSKKEKVTIWNFSKKLHDILKNWNIDKVFFEEKDLHWVVNKNQIYSFINRWIILIESKDIRKNRKWFRYIQNAISLLNLEKDIRDNLISELNFKIKAKNNPVTSNLYEKIDFLIKSIYKESYYKLMFAEKIITLNRDILRWIYNKNFNLELFILDFIKKYPTKFIKYDKTWFNFVKSLDDTIYTYESYSNEIFKQVISSKDVDLINSRIKEFEEVIKRHQYLTQSL
jgi:HrpA-like RNA helicase